ncbi:MAG: hypothetical protein LBF85_05930 [Tannerella sp.]|jgi:DNA-directed RNA polymerase specialized sigma24 family protein|nr:hypothetical protein [Tannerella sp.]
MKDEEKKRLTDKYGKIEDRELLARMFDGRDNGTALGYLLKVRYIAMVRNLLHHYREYDGDEQDFIQDLFELLYDDNCRRLRTYWKKAGFSAWLYAITNRFLYKTVQDARQRYSAGYAGNAKNAPDTAPYYFASIPTAEQY